MQIESYADANNNLNNEKNPFIETKDKLSKSSESNINMIKSVEEKGRGKYGSKDPIY